MRVSDIMVKVALKARPDEALDEIRSRMEADRIRHLPVVDAQEKVVGMLSDRDLLRARGFHRAPRRVSELMTTQVGTISPDAPAADAAKKIVDFKIDALPVVDHDKIVGIVTSTDCVALARRLLLNEGSTAPASTT